MRITSFNVNGLRATCGKSKEGEKGVEMCTIHSLIDEVDSDVLCFQEIKTSDNETTRKCLAKFRETHPFAYWNYSERKKGYSGTAILSKAELQVWRNFDKYPQLRIDWDPIFEGRVLTADMGKWYLINVYTPNIGRAQEGRIMWDYLFQLYCLCFDKPIIVCGDLNCAHTDLDVNHPEDHIGFGGCTPEERFGFSELLSHLVLRDAFRELYPKSLSRTFWHPYQGKRRTESSGWRLDYFLVSEKLFPQVRDVVIHREFYGSDHCPLTLYLE